MGPVLVGCSLILGIVAFFAVSFHVALKREADRSK
jgi:hypothetical protein